MNQATTRPLSDKTGQRLFCAQQHEPRLRLFRPVRPVVEGFSPEWGNDPFQAHKSQTRPRRARVEKVPDKGSGRGVKKEQVKGCGSVNRPTPSSQRPAEPVASGFFPGVNSPVFMGQFWSLGVKPWVRKQENPGIPGKIRGSDRGFGPKIQMGGTYDRRKKQSA